MRKSSWMAGAAALIITLGTVAGESSAGGWGGGYRANVGIYFGGPAWWGGYPYAGYYGYPGYYPYAYAPYYAYPAVPPYPAYYPYPAYAPPARIVYIQKPRVVAMAPPAPAPARPRMYKERYTLSAKELFAFDRDDLQLPQPKLDDIARALASNPQIHSVTITGYTDRLGSDAYNLRLSQRRAEAVKAYLVGKGIAPDRLVAIGKGEADPVIQCGNNNEAALIRCLEPNCRVEVEPITVERNFTQSAHSAR